MCGGFFQCYGYFHVFNIRQQYPYILFSLLVERVTPSPPQRVSRTFEQRVHLIAYIYIYFTVLPLLYQLCSTVFPVLPQDRCPKIILTRFFSEVKFESVGCFGSRRRQAKRPEDTSWRHLWLVNHGERTSTNTLALSYLPRPGLQSSTGRR